MSRAKLAAGHGLWGNAASNLKVLAPGHTKALFGAEAVLTAIAAAHGEEAHQWALHLIDRLIAADQATARAVAPCRQPASRSRIASTDE